MSDNVAGMYYNIAQYFLSRTRTGIIIEYPELDLYIIYLKQMRNVETDSSICKYLVPHFVSTHLLFCIQLIIHIQH